MTQKTLLPHQIEDAGFLAARRVAGNFSGMGSGKTLTALEAARLTGAKKITIVCPPIAMNMWQREANDHLHVSDATIIKTGKTPLRQNNGVQIMSYSIATKRFEELAGDVLILDESHACKSITAKRTKAILGRGGAIERFTHTWFLTGTPMTRWSDDLFPFLVRAANGDLRELIGGMSMERFRLRFCVTQLKTFSRYQRKPIRVVVGNRNTDELNDFIFGAKPLAVRRELKEVWAAMPPITKTRLEIRPRISEELRELLKALSKKTQSEIERDLRNKDESLSKTRRLLGEAKVEPVVAEIKERIEAGMSGILVGAWHTNVIDALLHQLIDAGIAVEKIDGRTSQHKRAQVQADFNAGNVQVLIGQISAMGVAIDLQHGGHNILVIEEDWSPAIMDQFYARMHRMGQAHHVSAEIFETDTKLDKAIRRIAGRKASEATRLMKQGDDE